MNRLFMRVFVTSLFGATALTTPTLAQTSAEFAAAGEDCRALEQLMVEGEGQLNADWRANANAVVTTADAEQCRIYYEEASAAVSDPEGSAEGATTGRIVVTQPEPQVSVEQSSPEVTVSQPQPQVSVRQPQPEIIVRQAQPTVRVQMPQPVITIDQPQPEIIVRMPEPVVGVTTPEPQVQVRQGEPTVSVEQGAPQVQVQESEDANANVQVNQGQAVVRQQEGNAQPQVDLQQEEPSITYEAAEPNVVFEETAEPEVRFTESGEPNIRVERMQGEQMQDRQSAAGDGRDPYAALRGTGQPFDTGAPQDYTVSDIIGQTVYGARNDELGTADRLVTDGSRNYVVLAEGGFLGFGEREVALPLDRLAVVNGQMVAGGLTDEDIEALPELDASQMQVIGDEHTVALGTR